MVKAVLRIRVCLWSVSELLWNLCFRISRVYWLLTKTGAAISCVYTRVRIAVGYKYVARSDLFYPNPVVESVWYGGPCCNISVCQWFIDFEKGRRLSSLTCNQSAMWYLRVDQQCNGIPLTLYHFKCNNSDDDLIKCLFL